MCKYVALAAALLVSSTSTAAELPRVRLDGIGVLKIGMSEHAAGRARGHRLTHLYPEAEENGCFYASAPGLPEGTSLMFLDGRLARVDVSGPEVRTISGARVGTSERKLKQIYGAKLEQRPHAYDGPVGHYLTLISSDKSLGVRFETDGSRVTGYYAGTAEAIQLIEGCQ